MKRFIALTLIFNLICFNSYAEEQCEEGFYFNTDSNRCLLKESVVDSKTDAMACEGLTDEAARACFDDNVANEVADLEADGEIAKQTDPKKKILFPMIITLGTAYYLFKKQDVLSKCGKISVYLMLAGGVTTLLGEFLTNRKYKKKLKKLASDYKSNVQDTDDMKDKTDVEITTQNQKQAFDFQIDQEHARADAHGGRKKTYNLAFALYTAATVAAIYEGFTNGWTPSQCDAKSSNSSSGETPPTAPETPPAGGSTTYLNYTPIEKNNTDTLFANSSAMDLFGDYYYIDGLTYAEMVESVMRTILSQLSISAIAEEGGQSNGTAAAGAIGLNPASENITATLPGVEGASNSLSGLDNIAGSPAFRAAISGILALNSRKVAKQAGELEKEANKRAEVIAKVRDEFLAAGGAGFNFCTPEERRKPSKPICFCYTEDGQRNPARLDSPTCKAQFGANPANIPGATDYSSSGRRGSRTRGDCLNKSGTANISRIGQCSKLTGSLNLGPIGDIPEANAAVDSASRLSSGRISPAELNDGSAVRAAFKLQGNLEKLRKNPKTKADVAKVDNARRDIRRNLGLSINKGFKSGALNPNSFGGLGGSSAVAPKDILSPKEILKKTDNDVESIKRSSGNNLAIKRSKKRSLDDYDFGSESRGGVVIDESVGAIMKKNYDLNDINENESVSIFKIINNRYQLTGLKRLFAEDEAAPEKPSDEQQEN